MNTMNREDFAELEKVAGDVVVGGLKDSFRKLLDELQAKGATEAQILSLVDGAIAGMRGQPNSLTRAGVEEYLKRQRKPGTISPPPPPPPPAIAAELPALSPPPKKKS